MTTRLERLCARAEELGVDGSLADLLERYVTAAEKSARACKRFRWGRSCGGVQAIEMSIVPPAVYELGPLVAVTYAAKKGSDPFAHWEHDFERPLPRLVTDAEGSQLWIAGGGYRVTERGIVG